MILALALACAGGDDPVDTPDTGTDSGDTGSADTDTADTDSGDTDSGDTDSADTDDTAADPLPGTMSVTAVGPSGSVAWACDATTPPDRFLRAFQDALGNLAGSLGCADVQRLTVGFVKATDGTYADATGPLTWSWTDGAGTAHDAWAEATAPTLTIDFERLDVGVLHAVGTVSGRFGDVDVAAAFDLDMPCTGGC